MSDFTIEQLEALKEGTTPGPWERFHETWEEYNPDGDAVLEYEQYGIIGGADGILDTLPVKSLMDAPNQWAESGEHDNAANTRLAAAAPALVDALIAEKQAHAKLRAEVEKLRDRKRSLSKIQYQTARDLKNGIFDETFGTMPETHTVEAWEMGARSNQRTATALTRILGADDG